MKRLKGALRGGGGVGAGAAAPDPAAADQLTALLRVLGACVSLVHERRHELLLKELLDTPLWQVPQVGWPAAACFWPFCQAATPMPELL